jgi:hypothetical protein
MILPLNEVADAVRDLIWSACATPLQLKGAYKTISEIAAVQDPAAIYPQVLLLEPRFSGERPAGVSPTPWPLQSATCSWLLVYTIAFEPAETTEAWADRLLDGASTIVQAVTAAELSIPTCRVKRVWVSDVQALAEPDDPSLVVRLAEAQIRVNVDLEIEV